MLPDRPITRREFHARTAVALGCGAAARPAASADAAPYRLRYIVASCLYGKAPLAEILPEVRKCGAEHIEIWTEPHGNQREQIDSMGLPAFAELLQTHDVKLGTFTCFKQGLFDMRGEMEVVQRLGGDMVICNSGGPRGLSGDALETAVREFAERLKPHVAYAEERGIAIGLENHGGGLINTPDSQRLVLDLIPSRRFGIALAPAHLPQDAPQIARLIGDLGERLLHVQAWGFGKGFIGVQHSREEQLQQLPHRGSLDWTPIVAALKRISYAGRVEVFMHPTPRGVPILDTTEQVTAEINRARRHLEDCLASV
jgi:sugar phosphate isomerase/epimerase